MFDAVGNATHTALMFNLVGEDVLITGAGPVGILAIAIAKYVLPVPAGPMPNTIIFLRIRSIYAFCPAVFGFTGFP